MQNEDEESIIAMTVEMKTQLSRINSSEKHVIYILVK